MRAWLAAAVAAALAIALAAALPGGCASLQKDRTVCPEYRNLRCGTTPDCTMDQARGCRVCRCSPADDLSVPPPESAQPPN